MKKSFLQFPPTRRTYLPLVISRRFGGKAAHFRSMAGKTDGEEGDEEAGKKLMEKINGRIAEALVGRATSAELKAIQDAMPEGLKDLPIIALRELADKDKGALAMLAAQGLEIQKLNTKIKAQPEDLSIRAQIKTWMEENKEVIQKMKTGDRNALPTALEIQLDVRADSPMLPSTVMPGGSAYITRFEVQKGYNELLRPEPTFWETIKKSQTNAETYIWVNKRPTVGAAGFISPGVYKPAISFTVAKEQSYAKKIAANEKCATELLEDIDGFKAWMEDELYYQVMQKMNDKLSGDQAADSETPEGLKHMSLPYNALTGVSTINANFWDALKAMVTMLRITRFKGQIFAYVNPVDLANGVMTKAISQGQLFVPPAIGATIIEDLNMPLGYVQVVAMDYYKLLIYKGFRMEWGLEMDDLTKNLRTVIGEMRVHQFHSSNYDGFAVYDSIQNVKDAINVAP